MASATQGDPKTAQTVYEFNVNDIKGETISLEKYRGHVLIIVNVASKCGYTAQHYKELNEMYAEFGESKGNYIFIKHFYILTLTNPISLNRELLTLSTHNLNFVKAFILM